MLIIDVKAGTEMYNGCFDDYYEILALFVKELQANQNDLKSIKREGDLQQFKFIVHKIRGGASYCSVPILSDLTKKIEESVTTKDTTGSGMEDQVDSLSSSIGQVIDAFHGIKSMQDS